MIPRENRAADAPGAERCPLRPCIGWREWLALPGLGIPAIKAKVDTGARTSTLHAYFAESFRQAGKTWVRFGVHPLQRRGDVAVTCVAPLLDRRMVRDSGGHLQRRYVIETRLRLGDLDWLAEMTLTARDGMLFRMLLGRSAIRGRFLVEPRASYLASRRPPLDTLYPELES
jgi:hypothetical protein